MFDIDPDMNYYNKLDYHIALNCGYHFEDSITAAIRDKTKEREYDNVFSLCHANIGSLKTNLSAFELCLKNMDIKFTAIDICEIWLNVDILHANSFITLINHPARVQKESATLIDNIFTNNHGRLDQTF